MNNIPATIIVTLISSGLTYLAAVKSSKTNVEGIYTEGITKIIDEYNKQLGELKNEIKILQEENKKLQLIIRELKGEV